MRHKLLNAPISVLLLLSVAACSSSNNDPVSDAIDPITGEPAVLTPGSEPTVDVNQNDPDTSDPTTPEETDPVTEPPNDDPSLPPDDDPIEPPDDDPVDPPTDPELPTQPPVDAEPTLEELGVPTIDGDNNAAVRTFGDLLQQVVTAGLVDLNQKLQSGEQFSDAEAACLGSFDPAIGEALTAIDCGDGRLALENDVYPLYISTGSLAATSECNDALLALDGTACRLVNAAVTVPVEWTTPEVGLPQPFNSGDIDFNNTPGSLRITSLPDSITPYYDCEFEFSTGLVFHDTASANCDNQLDDLSERLQVWLDRRANQ